MDLGMNNKDQEIAAFVIAQGDLNLGVSMLLPIFNVSDLPVL